MQTSVGSVADPKGEVPPTSLSPLPGCDRVWSGLSQVVTCEIVARDAQIRGMVPDRMPFEKMGEEAMCGFA